MVNRIIQEIDQTIEHLSTIRRLTLMHGHQAEVSKPPKFDLLEEYADHDVEWEVKHEDTIHLEARYSYHITEETDDCTRILQQTDFVTQDENMSLDVFYSKCSKVHKNIIDAGHTLYDVCIKPLPTRLKVTSKQKNT